MRRDAGTEIPVIAFPHGGYRPGEGEALGDLGTESRLAGFDPGAVLGPDLARLQAAEALQPLRQAAQLAAEVYLRSDRQSGTYLRDRLPHGVGDRLIRD